MKTVSDALARARALGLGRLDAQLVVAAQLGRSRSWVLAHEDAPLDSAADRVLEGLLRRADGVPLAYLVGRKEFYGLMLKVTPQVLVPRPETELLVDWALGLALGAGARVIDLGTGSGAIAAALKTGRADWQVTASDASGDALLVAGDNARELGLEIDFRLGTWWQVAAPGEHFDLAVSNPPYVAEGDAHLAALAHEPRRALVAGRDGLDDLRTLIAGAPRHLRPGGWLLVEHGHAQADAVQALFAGTGFVDISTRRDLAGHDRCTGARRCR